VKLPRRQFLHLAAGAAALPALSRAARAQTYPTRPVHSIVTFAPGGGLDVVARLTMQSLSERLGHPFIVENRPGAGGTLGVESAANASPDGYTLLMVSSANATSAALYRKSSVDITRDIVPIGGIVRVPNVMCVTPSLPPKTVPEFISYVKANPGKVNMASAGLGTTGHMNGELFKMLTGIDMLHVPYRGGGPAMSDLIAGHVQLLFEPIPSSIEYIKGGKVRALAVTSATRSDSLPDIPALQEFVSDYEANFWVGVGAPKGVSAEIVGTLNKELNATLADPKFKARLADMGGTAIAGPPSAFGKLMADEADKWGKVVKFAGLKAD
jgi:tripartite-type tricarboxylate transporter receptor subunit TctC